MHNCIMHMYASLGTHVCMETNLSRKSHPAQFRTLKHYCGSISSSLIQI